jgi:hypothetical protein
MSEMLFSENQLRAALAVEEFTDMDPSYYGHIRDFRRVLGGVFGRSNFWSGKVLIGRPEHRGRVDYHVVERDAGLILGHAHATLADALAEARALIVAMGPVLLAKMIADRSAKRPSPREIAVAARIKTPRKISKRARAVFDSSGGKCHYCDTTLTLDGRWHIEHKMPRALFGGSEQENLVAACAPCNHAKRDKTDLEFIALRNEA